ncbi:M67 family metallopeptidase [Helicobacter sp. 13S00477-4]|uniref:M67 family metallopeptidase n=1 Tax=Helicobacter sp. 13S00477-4 TaxID=1905759 RepID=UPI000BA57F25|nr:M67 family metallopeptidase [Helicobacter sp. 13S00477-4]PAF52750.1 hypothetical protein BKH44_00775 [Helicobacter sp. 13S00477-4]
MIHLNKKLYEKLIHNAKYHYPNECCGYLIGKQNPLTLDNHINEIFEIKNIHQNPQHFFILDPKDQLKAFQKAKKQNLDIVGIFHSHPFSEAYPSSEDLKYIYDNRQSYCIISLKSEPIILSYRIDTKKIYKEKIKF